MLKPVFLLAGLASTGLALTLVPLGAETGPGARITTDTTEYCASLESRLAGLPGSAQQRVQALTNEGIRLCRNGHARTGIAKLRRALRAAQAAE
jgi:hypothetical protein